MSKFGISARTAFLSYLAAANVLFVAGAGWWGINSLQASVDEGATVSAVVSRQQFGDMMHDALRGDVLLAYQLASEGKTVADAGEIFGAIKEHGDELVSAMEENRKASLSDEARASLEAAIPVVAEYYRAAQETARVAFTAPEAYREKYVAFQAVFESLEGKMEALTTQISSMMDHVKAKGDATGQFVTWLLGIAAVLALAVAGFSAWYMRVGVIRPLDFIRQRMAGLAAGDVESDVPFSGRADEIGEMASAVESFRVNAQEIARLGARQKELEARALEDRRITARQLADDFETQIGEIVNAVAQSATEVERHATSMSTSAEQTTLEMSNVAGSLEQASSSVQAAATAGEELSASIQEISRQVVKSATLASETVEDARRTDETVQNLAQASQKIGDVVNLINDIASQTNLLALNATIEAARAGEAGKGFAVVASEVKSLANQTAHATGEISRQIATSQAITENAVKAIRAISERISEMSQIASAISAAVTQQDGATREISQSMTAAASGTHDVNRSLTSVTKMAGESGVVAEHLSSSSSRLSQQSVRLKSAVESIVKTVRAAS